MNRLTGWDKNNAYCLKCFENGGCPDMDTSRCDFCEHHIAVYDRLARYEDTSLMPEDVVRLNDFSKSQAVKLLEKNGRLRAENEPLSVVFSGAVQKTYPFGIGYAQNARLLISGM